MNAEELFLTNLALIDRIVRFVCRRNHYREDEAEDFAGHVRLKLIENDYAILRKFEGRSSFSTYLTTVIQRMSFQYRVRLWGKWRPSAEAKRLGDVGITLERMLTRDGLSLHEAIEMLTTGAHPAYSRAELQAAYARLPHRTPRPVLVQESDAAYAIASSSDTEDGITRRDRERASRAAAAAVDAAMKAMDPEDQLILQMRFWSARRVPDIAAALGIDQRKLYKRIEQLLAGLRKSLESAGIDRRQLVDLLESGEADFAVHAENADLRRSQLAEHPVSEEERQSR